MRWGAAAGVIAMVIGACTGLSLTVAGSDTAASVPQAPGSGIAFLPGPPSGSQSSLDRPSLDVTGRPVNTVRAERGCSGEPLTTVLEQTVHVGGTVVLGRMTGVGRTRTVHDLGGPAATEVEFEVERALLGEFAPGPASAWTIGGTAGAVTTPDHWLVWAADGRFLGAISPSGADGLDWVDAVPLDGEVVRFVASCLSPVGFEGDVTVRAAGYRTVHGSATGQAAALDLALLEQALR